MSHSKITLGTLEKAYKTVGGHASVRPLQLGMSAHSFVNLLRQSGPFVLPSSQVPGPCIPDGKFERLHIKRGLVAKFMIIENEI